MFRFPPCRSAGGRLGYGSVTDSVFQSPFEESAVIRPGRKIKFCFDDTKFCNYCATMFASSMNLRNSAILSVNSLMVALSFDSFTSRISSRIFLVRGSFPMFMKAKTQNTKQDWRTIRKNSTTRCRRWKPPSFLADRWPLTKPTPFQF